MQTIPTQAVKSQTLTTQVGAQPVRVNLYQQINGLYADVLVNDTPIVTGVLCRHAVRLVRDAYRGFVGDLAVYDTSASEDPYYSGLGSRWQLVYFAPADL